MTAVDTSGSTVTNTTVPSQNAPDRIWILVFVACFLGLMVDGMDFMFLSYALPSLMKDMALSKVQAGSLGSYTLLGMALGGLFGGWATDRFGRIRTLIFTLVLFSIGTAVLAFSQNFWQFAIIRFISALGLGAEYVTCNTLMSEYVPTRFRTTVMGTLQAGWAVGYVVATVLAGAIVPQFGWRWMFASSLPWVLLAFVVRQFVPESPSWKQSVARQAAAKAEGLWKEVLLEPRNRRSFILWVLTSGFMQFGLYGVNSWLPTYLVNELKFNFTKMTGYLVGTYCAAIFGKVIAGYLADKFGRRCIYAVSCFTTAFFLPLVVYYRTPYNIVALLTILGFIVGTPSGIIGTYMTETFSTRIRGTAMGGSFNLGRVGAAVGPAVIGLIATHYSIGLGLIAVGGGYFIAAVISSLAIPGKQFDPQKGV